MWSVVRETFPAWSARFEGRLGFMFLDVFGLVSTGVGILLEPIDLALELPWRCGDGRLASPSEISSAWHAVKAHQELAPDGGSCFRRVTTLRLADVDIDSLTLRKLDQVEGQLRDRFPSWGTWPAPAQLATLSMAWAMGPAFRFPKFEAAVDAIDFESAARECHMDETGQNPSFRRRNEANRALFESAAKVMDEGLPRDVFPLNPELMAANPA